MIMNINVKNDKITVTKRSKTVFETMAESIDSVRLLSATNYSFPTFIRNLFNIKSNYHLNCIILWSGSESISLLTRDRGFEDLKVWLIEHGWALDKGIEKSLQTPLVRIEVTQEN